MKIGLDIMGGVYAPKKTIHGAILALKQLPKNIKVVLFGEKNIIISELKSHNFSESKFEIIDCTEVIGMHEHATKAFRSKPNSSISKGFEYLAKGEIDGFASAGNTGAMFVGGFYTVKTIPGVLRPPLATIFPKENGGVNLLLDVGVNADCKPDVLYQFGVLGSLYARHVLEINNPRVGLLNIGEEPEKGNLLSQASYNLMKDSKDFNFTGNIEGRDLFDDKCDVMVCDGFTGNVVLKEAEAFYHLLKKRGMLDDYFSRFNYENYGGSPILGINSNVVVGHGISNDVAIKNMIKLTADVVKANLSNKITEAFK